MTTEPTRLTTARDALRDRVLQRRLHPQAAAQQFMEMTLRAIGGAEPNVERDTLVWMAQQAVFFTDFCRRLCDPSAEEEN